MDFIKKMSKKNFKILLTIILVICFLIMIISLVVSGNKKKKCNSLKDEILAITDKYVEDNNLLPTLNGESVIVELSLLDEKVSFKKKEVTGTVTYTKYNDEYIKTFEIENASYCTTDKFGKETDNYNSKNNVKVNVYFNYYTVDSYNSKWTNFMPSEDINTEETNGVLLPKNEKDLPTIPDNAVITEYVRETKTYYSYRDKKWKWYKNNVKYSDYSSTQPSGYTNKDKSTESSTEKTEWSLDYPEVYDYRHITSKTGYQWYKMDGKEKIYWENGKYSVESPGNEYKKDSKNSAKMYSYTDDVWRWYNGDTKRVYSSSSSTQPKGYNYKDESTLTYSKWSSFKDTSSLTNDNKSYREEQTDTYSRYLIKYDIYSYAVLDEPVTLEELENILGKSYEEISKDKSLKVEVTFKFQNEA